MSEFEDQLQAILSDPAELSRITALASQLMGGAAAAPPPEESDDNALLRRLGGLLGGAGSRDVTALLNALAPYLRPERQARLRRALRLAGMLKLAGRALREEGAEGV